MATRLLPVPSYAEVSVSHKDERTGVESSQFNPVWLHWFLEQQARIDGPADLVTGVTGVLPPANGGTGQDISTYFTGTVIIPSITTLGTQGSLTVTTGLIVSYTAPT